MQYSVPCNSSCSTVLLVCNAKAAAKKLVQLHGSCLIVVINALRASYVCYLQDGPIAHGSNFRMRSLPAIIPSSANSLEMAGGLCLSRKKRKILGLVWSLKAISALLQDW